MCIFGGYLIPVIQLLILRCNFCRKESKTRLKKIMNTCYIYIVRKKEKV